MAAAKKEEKEAIKTALVAGTETLSNLFGDFRYLWYQPWKKTRNKILNWIDYADDRNSKPGSTNGVTNYKIKTNDVTQDYLNNDDVTKEYLYNDDVTQDYLNNDDVTQFNTKTDDYAHHKMKTNDVTQHRMKTNDVIVHPHNFKPSAFHFHFSGLDKSPDPDRSSGLEESKRNAGILSKLEDMFDYLRSFGTT
jgi:hypothetical protein